MIKKLVNLVSGLFKKKTQVDHRLPGYYVHVVQGKLQVLYERLENGTYVKYHKNNFDIVEVKLDSVEEDLEKFEEGYNSTPTLSSMIENLTYSGPKLKLHTYYLRGNKGALYYVYGIHSYRLDVLKLSKSLVKETSIYTLTQGNYTEISPSKVAELYPEEMKAHKQYFANKQK